MADAMPVGRPISRLDLGRFISPYLYESKHPLIPIFVSRLIFAASFVHSCLISDISFSMAPSLLLALTLATFTTLSFSSVVPRHKTGQETPFAGFVQLPIRREHRHHQALGKRYDTDPLYNVQGFLYLVSSE